MSKRVNVIAVESKAITIGQNVESGFVFGRFVDDAIQALDLFLLRRFIHFNDETVFLVAVLLVWSQNVAVLSVIDNGAIKNGNEMDFKWSTHVINYEIPVVRFGESAAGFSRHIIEMIAEIRRLQSIVLHLDREINVSIVMVLASATHKHFVRAVATETDARAAIAHAAAQIRRRRGTSEMIEVVFEDDFQIVRHICVRSGREFHAIEHNHTVAVHGAAGDVDRLGKFARQRIFVHACTCIRLDRDPCTVLHLVVDQRVQSVLDEAPIECN